jgi:hypothetical protein
MTKLLGKCSHWNLFQAFNASICLLANHERSKLLKAPKSQTPDHTQNHPSSALIPNWTFSVTSSIPGNLSTWMDSQNKTKNTNTTRKWPILYPIPTGFASRRSVQSHQMMKKIGITPPTSRQIQVFDLNNTHSDSEPRKTPNLLQRRTEPTKSKDV